MRRLVAVVAGALVLGACSGLPARTPIATGRPVGGVAPDAIRVAVQGPVPGADARESVAGFLRAGVGYDDDPTVAQAFLTGAALAQWQPHGVVIYDNDVAPVITVTDATTTTAKATVSVPVTGALDADGHYRDLPTGTTSRLALTLTKGPQGWRIASGLTGVGALMSRADFARYAPFTIAYAAPRSDLLVPDERWLAQGPGLPTRLARAVLAAAPSYLQGAVATGVPAYTDLVGSVAVADGVATVQVDGRATDADQQARRTLWARLVGALAQVRGVDAVQVVAGGTRLAVDGLPDRPLRTTDVALVVPPPGSGRALLRAAGVLRAVDATALRPGVAPAAAAGPALPRLTPSWYHLALSGDGELAAVGGDDAELARWRGTTQVRVPRFADSLTRPCYDSLGTLWVAGHTPAGERLFALDTRAAATTSRAPTALNVPWLQGRVVRAVRVAPDGVRVAVASTDEHGGAARLDVAGIVRTGSAPVALAAPRQVAADVLQVVDVGWLDDGTLALLGRRSPTVPLRVVVAPLNGSVTLLGEVAHAESLTTLGDGRSVAVTTSEGRVLLRAGSTFARLADAADLVVANR